MTNSMIFLYTLIFLALARDSYSNAYKGVVRVHNSESFSLFKGTFSLIPLSIVKTSETPVEWCFANCLQCLCGDSDYNNRCNGCCYECTSCEDYYWHCPNDRCACDENNNSDDDDDYNFYRHASRFYIKNECNCSNQCPDVTISSNIDSSPVVSTSSDSDPSVVQSSTDNNSISEVENHTSSSTSDFNIDLTIPALKASNNLTRLFKAWTQHALDSLSFHSYILTMLKHNDAQDTEFMSVHHCTVACMEHYLNCDEQTLLSYCRPLCKGPNEDIQDCMDCIHSNMVECYTNLESCSAECLYNTVQETKYAHSKSEDE